jgi:hypothetical protein
LFPLSSTTLSGHSPGPSWLVFRKWQNIKKNFWLRSTIWPDKRKKYVVEFIYLTFKPDKERQNNENFIFLLLVKSAGIFALFLFFTLTKIKNLGCLLMSIIVVHFYTFKIFCKIAGYFYKHSCPTHHVWQVIPKCTKGPLPSQNLI